MNSWHAANIIASSIGTCNSAEASYTAEQNRLCSSYFGQFLPILQIMILVITATRVIIQKTTITTKLTLFLRTEPMREPKSLLLEAKTLHLDAQKAISVTACPIFAR